MLVTEFIALILTLGLGISVGYQSKSKQSEMVKQPYSRPLDWGPKQHQDTMVICKSVCDNGVLRYEPITGECECQPVTKS